MNKGLEIWAKKRAKKQKIANTKKPDQIGICRFIEFKDIQFFKINGKYTHNPNFIKRYGLQIEHNFLYIDNDTKDIKTIKINKHGAKILKIYNNTPDWASSLLIDKKEEFLNKI